MDYTPPWCPYCRAHGSTRVRCTVAANGDVRYFWYCLTCGRRPRGGDCIAHEVVAQWDAEGFLRESTFEPLHDARTGQQCAVDGCTATDVEEHHWAPRAYRERFGPSWKAWPTTWLCRAHHALWHRIVTPGLRGEQW